MKSCEHLTKTGLEEKEKREKELASYQIAHKEACLHVQEKSVEKVKEYKERKEKVWCVFSVGVCVGRGGGGGLMCVCGKSWTCGNFSQLTVY